ncbi:MAG: hypothetical protein WCG40_01100 [Actinomycetes bacterium]
MNQHRDMVGQAVEQDFNVTHGASIPPLPMKKCETENGIVSKLQLNVGLADT